jgi:iron complex transport system permease protein
MHTGKMIPLKLTIISLLSLSALLVCPFIGIKTFSLQEIVSKEEFRFIFFQIRIPRTIAAFFTGGGLAVAGMVFQALFRNPLASPYTLGISGGASLGATLCIALGAGSSIMGISVISLGAIAGGFLSMALVYGFILSKDSDSTTLVLAGVVVSTVCSGLIMFIHQISPLQHAFQIMRWTMGGVDGITHQLLIMMLIPVMLFFLVVTILLPQLDQFMTGDDIAYTRGVNVRLSRNILISITALAVGFMVAACGPIGFVGIVAPHACRIIIPGARHRMLALCSFLTGASFLTISDTIARVLVPPAEIPVGIITAIFGGPFFLVALFKRKNRLMI